LCFHRSFNGKRQNKRDLTLQQGKWGGEIREIIGGAGSFTLYGV